MKCSLVGGINVRVGESYLWRDQGSPFDRWRLQQTSDRMQGLYTGRYLIALQAAQLPVPTGERATHHGEYIIQGVLLTWRPGASGCHQPFTHHYCSVMVLLTGPPALRCSFGLHLWATHSVVPSGKLGRNLASGCNRPVVPST